MVAKPTHSDPHFWTWTSSETEVLSNYTGLNWKYIGQRAWNIFFYHTNAQDLWAHCYPTKPLFTCTGERYIGKRLLKAHIAAKFEFFQ